MISNELYFVYVDGLFEGITEDEDDYWDIVADAVNGIKEPILDDDIADRVDIQKVSINRYYQDGHTICDKLTDKTVLCYNSMDCYNGVKHFNELNLEKERAEAQLRAMTL